MEKEVHATDSIYNIKIETLNYFHTLFGKAYPINGDTLAWVNYYKK